MIELWDKFWALEIELWKAILFFVAVLVGVYCCGIWQSWQEEKKWRS